eukprot:gnl/Dysnectes_brevis/3061_a3796_1515.p1 GENE.gnl/Dysnectes_brevis/3061_a3796_1515~~gnl/Dysnectes_brevis/3061_a3796_1515.p1  ORF type:complete len:331 (-),score=33.49 gnl/Dysnectes_brevis/3061_a3796_1515:42-1034(-)
MNYTNVVAYSTASANYLLESLCTKLKLSRGSVTRKHFMDEESYYKLDIDSRTALVGRDVVYISSTASDTDLLELIRCAYTLSELGTHRRIFIIPFLGYSTMERDSLPGEVVTAKIVMNMLSNIPSPSSNIFLFFDLHTAGLRRYMSPQVQSIELYCESLLIDAVKEIITTPKEYVVASADLGRTAWVSRYASILGTDMAFVRKVRQMGSGDGEAATASTVHEVIGNVEGKRVILYDDMLRSGGTLIHAASAYIGHGAVEVIALVSHCALPNPSIVTRIDESPVTRIITTNTHPSSQLPEVQSSDKFTVLDITSVIAQCLESGILKHQAPL